MTAGAPVILFGQVTRRHGEVPEADAAWAGRLPHAEQAHRLRMVRNDGRGVTVERAARPAALMLFQMTRATHPRAG